MSTNDSIPDPHTAHFDRRWEALRRRLNAANLARVRAQWTPDPIQAHVYDREADRQIEAMKEMADDDS